MDWIRKIASYAPDIALALTSGGTSTLGSIALRLVSEALTGVSTTSEKELKSMVEVDFSEDDLQGLAKVNNQFLIDKLRIEKEDAQKRHTTTQETIRNGDNSQYWFVRFTRPMQSWVCLGVAGFLAIHDSRIEYVGMFLAVTGAYMGMREFGKWKTSDSLTKLSPLK